MCIERARRLCQMQKMSGPPLPSKAPERSSHSTRQVFIRTLAKMKISQERSFRCRSGLCGITTPALAFAGEPVSLAPGFGKLSAFLQRSPHEIFDGCLFAQNRLGTANNLKRVRLLESKRDESENSVVEFL